MLAGLCPPGAARHAPGREPALPADACNSAAARDGLALVTPGEPGPLARYGDVVWTSGNKPHEGGSDAALFLADTKSNVIEVYLLSKGTLSHRAEKGAAIPLDATRRPFFAKVDPVEFGAKRGPTATGMRMRGTRRAR